MAGEKAYGEKFKATGYPQSDKYHLRDYLLIGRQKQIFTKERSGVHHLKQDIELTRQWDSLSLCLLE